MAIKKPLKQPSPTHLDSKNDCNVLLQQMIVKFEELGHIRKKHVNQSIVLTVGSFDLLHAGHITYLNKLKKMGDILVVGVDSDSRVRERKGSKRPIFNQSQRVKILDSLKYVDYVLVTPRRFKQKDMPTLRLIGELKPNLFVAIINKWKKFEKLIENSGTKLKIVRRSSSDSTTKIIQMIQQGGDKKV